MIKPELLGYGYFQIKPMRGWLRSTRATWHSYGRSGSTPDRSAMPWWKQYGHWHENPLLRNLHGGFLKLGGRAQINPNHPF